MESPGISPQIYGQLISNKRVKNAQWEKASSINGAGETRYFHEKNEFGSISYPIQKKKSQNVLKT